MEMVIIIKMIMVVITPGTFILTNNGKALLETGVLTQQDVVNAREADEIDYNEIADSYGGDFFSGLRQFGEKIFKGIKTAIKKVAPIVKEAAPIIKELAPIATRAAPLLLGVGKRGRRRGKKRGGAIMSRAELRKRLMEEL